LEDLWLVPKKNITPVSLDVFLDGKKKSYFCPKLYFYRAKNYFHMLYFYNSMTSWRGRKMVGQETGIMTIIRATNMTNISFMNFIISLERTKLCMPEITLNYWVIIKIPCITCTTQCFNIVIYFLNIKVNLKSNTLIISKF
jgi:hypothetical protein